MSKSTTIDALIESAIRHFARNGYEGASLREIANDAGAHLSTIDRYFGSKYRLFRAVIRQVTVEVERDRSSLLSAVLANNESGTLPLEDLICALARPIVQRALSDDERDLSRILLLKNRRPRRRRSAGVADTKLSPADEYLSTWIDAMSRACPTLAKADVVWAFSYLSGLVYSRQIIEGRYDRLCGESAKPTVDALTADLVAFGCAGVEALIARRNPADFRKSSPS